MISLRLRRRRKLSQMRRVPIPLEGPHDWYFGKRPKNWEVRCFPTREQALHAFVESNLDTTEPWGGPTREHGYQDFDSINEKYGLKGDKRVKTIGHALWQALPTKKPYCLDKIDLDALNDTSPGMEHPFVVPVAAATEAMAATAGKYRKQVEYDDYRKFDQEVEWEAEREAERHAAPRSERPVHDEPPDDYHEPWRYGHQPAQTKSRPRRKKLTVPGEIVGTFCEKSVAKARGLDPRSLRWKQSGEAWILVGCPREAWRPIKKRCRVGTKAYKVLAPIRSNKCPRGTKRVEK